MSLLETEAGSNQEYRLETLETSNLGSGVCMGSIR